MLRIVRMVINVRKRDSASIEPAPFSVGVSNEIGWVRPTKEKQ